MRLIELGDKRPIAAGKAKLEYKSIKDLCTEGKYPHRDGNLIVLPYEASLELFSLQEHWNQFLVSAYGELWFGGTDENPFLVRMDPRALKEYLMGGPEHFYESIIPQRIIELSRIVGKEYVRQGDIFALPMDFDWETLSKAYSLLSGKELPMVKCKDEQVFETRHTLTGQRTELRVKVHGVEGLNLAEGKVAAPDHSLMTLIGPHAIHQTRNLYDPKNAD